MDRNPNFIRGAQLQGEAKLCLQGIRPVIQRLGQCFYSVFRKFITCQQHGLDPNGRHILVLAIVAACRDHALAVRRISGQQTGRCAAIHRQQGNTAAVGQFFNHRGLYAGRTEQRVDLTALQLLGRIGVVQVDLLDQLFVQAISRQNLFGVLLRAGFFLANADGLALQLLHGVDAGICPHNNMAFFLIQYRHGAEVIFYLRFRKSAGLVVSILGHIRLYHRHLQVPAGQQPQACRRTGGFTHFQLLTAVLGLQSGVILTKYLVHAAGAGHTQTDGFVAARSQQ